MLDRYLQAVKVFLPARQQDDIVRELSENLLSQMEDREETLGRPLTEDEQADILRRHGHPMIVAARYRQHQYLIGPAVFPIYLYALKLGVGVAALVTFVLAAIMAALHGETWSRLLDGMQAFPWRALMVFAWTTLGFAVFEVAQSRLRVSQRWDPRKLPRVVRHEDRIPRLQTIVELAFAVAFVVWILMIPDAPYLIVGPAAPYVAAAPVWELAYLPIVLLSLATVALYDVNFIWPEWTRRRSMARIAVSAGVLLVAVFLLRAGEWVVARPVAAAAFPDGLRVDVLVRVMNVGFHIGLAVTIIVNVIEIARESYKLKVRGRGVANQAAAHGSH